MQLINYTLTPGILLLLVLLLPPSITASSHNDATELFAFVLDDELISILLLSVISETIESIADHFVEEVGDSSFGYGELESRQPLFRNSCVSNIEELLEASFLDLFSLRSFISLLTYLI